MELGNQVGIPTVIFARGSQSLYFLTSISELFLGHVSQAVSGYFVQLKAAVQVQSAAAHCKPVLPMAWSFLPGFGSWLSGPCDIYIYIDNCFVSGTEYTGGSNLPMHLLFSVNHGWVMKHTLLGLDLFAIFFSPL